MCQHCEAKPTVFKVPNWTYAQIRNAVPAEAFERSTTKSLLYLFRDIVMCSAMAYATYQLDAVIGATQALRSIPYATVALRYAVWATYWWFQGLAFCGLWHVAHECGHGSFSSSAFVSDVVGFIIHTFFGTPYYSWKYSHRTHHVHNAHAEKDAAWIPKVLDSPPIKAAITEVAESMEDTPIYHLSKLLFQQAVGWPLYLMMNVSGSPKYPKWTNHFNPNSPLFGPAQRKDIVLSDIGLAAVGYGWYQVSKAIGFSALFKLWVVPWMLLSHWLVMVVFLQHTDPSVPHYRDSHWTFVRGAISTIDRNFLGWQGEFFFHYASRHHIAHHLFPMIPWYNLPIATKAIKETLGKEYRYCESNVFQVLYNNIAKCQYIDPKGGVIFFKDLRGNAKHIAESED